MSGPAKRIDAAAEELRAFNHISRCVGEEWEYPSDSYTALGNLSHLLRMLPQVLKQAALPAKEAFKEGRVVVDGGASPVFAEARLDAALEGAKHATARLQAAVDEMHAATAALGYVVTGLDEDGEDS